MIAARPLAALLSDSGVVPRGPLSADPQVSGLSADSRTVRSGDVFFALHGSVTDGRRFVPQALAGGAVAVVSQGPPAGPVAVPWVEVDDARDALGRVARAWNGRPDLRMALVGVTGTKGKTTVTYLIESIARAAGRAVGRIGTVGYAFAERTVRGERTTPEAIELFALLAAMRDAGVTVVAMEVSSHALALRRVGDARFAVAAFLNLGSDHWEFHGGREAYFEAKSTLFTGLDPAATAVLPADDPLGAVLADRTRGRVVRFGRGERADVRVLDERSDLRGSSLRLSTPRGELALRTPLLGRYNVDNVAAATACAVALDWDDAAVVDGVASCRRVPGRLDPVDAGQPFAVLVDYAHTEESLRAALDAVRSMTRGRLVVVFGCGGDRDRGKRFGMGRAAAERADRVVLTSDNPRSEDPASILAEIERGVVAASAASSGYRIEPDRRRAIAAALAEACAGDAVLIAGKGHETTQTFRDRVEPFDDREVAAEALAGLGFEGGHDAGA